MTTYTGLLFVLYALSSPQSLENFVNWTIKNHTLKHLRINDDLGKALVKAALLPWRYFVKP